MNKRWTESILHVCRGMLMGGADVIPGVSGGTVALIVGIYERLVTAISRFDATSIRHLVRREFRELLTRIDLALLLPLGIGIGVGVVALGGAMNQLLLSPLTRPFTLAAFFGMILASTMIVARMIWSDSLRQVALQLAYAAAGAYVALMISRTTPGETEDPSLLFVFMCGMVAICAMILPGISGAYILLLLGTYDYFTDILKRLPHGDVSATDFLTIVTFGSGCVIGLLSFSRVLRWLLAYHKRATLSLLCGFMLGALRKIWPFQHDLNPDITKLKEKEFELYIPNQLSSDVLLVVLVAVVAALAIIIIARFTRRQEEFAKDEESSPTAQ